MQNFSELQCLVDNLVDFLELSMLNLNILFDEVGRGPGKKKKKKTLTDENCRE